MRIRKYFTVLMVSLFLLTSCAPRVIKPVQHFEPKFDRTPPYEVGLDLPKPDKIVPIYVDENFQRTTIDKAKFVVLAPAEYAKVAALVKLAKNYKAIAKEQQVLVNIHIDTINALKEYVALEQAKARAYNELAVHYQNAYNQEAYYHRLDNAIHKGMFAVITIGAIIALIAL